MAYHQDPVSAEPLLEKETCNRCARPQSRSWKNQKTFWILSYLTLSILFSFILSLVWLKLPSFAKLQDHSSTVRTLQPARSSLRYVIIQPEPDAWYNKLYTGEPSQESDLAWSDLQTVRAVWLDQDESDQVNMSGLMAGERRVASLLGVMHNLHCIRFVRQLLYSDYYYPESTTEDNAKRVKHAGHCLEAMRRSVMCTPDLTPLSTFWEDDEREAIALNPSTKQHCVDWSSLVEWERGRNVTLQELWTFNPGSEDGDVGSEVLRIPAGS